MNKPTTPAKPRARKTAAPKPPVKDKATPNKPPAPSNCACNCGKPTITAKAVFLSGHDARHAGSLGRALAARPTDKALKESYDRLSPALQKKVDTIRATAVKKQAVKDARDAAKKAADDAREAVLKAAGV